MSNSIRDVRAIITQPGGRPFVVVKVETDEPELHGVGCASMFTRPTLVAAAVDDYLKPFLVGKDPADIEDVWQSCNVSAYWRNGPVLNNALSGVDQALWDIKGKVAGVPVYDLFGGKSREAAAVYVGGDVGGDLAEREDHVSALLEQGFRHFKLGGPGSVIPPDSNYALTEHCHEPVVITGKVTAGNGSVSEPAPVARSVLRAFEHFRAAFGPGPEILYDVHERLPPVQALALAKDVEPFKPFFMEDVFAPEDNEYFRLARQQTSTPMAMGELYSNPQEMVPMIKDRLIDFIRVHISTIGGLTPARKLAALCEVFDVRTAWHGSSDISPVGHAANLMLDMHVWNFGIQEACAYLNIRPVLKELFPGIPEVRGGYMWPNGGPGLGVDIDEELAARFPARDLGDLTELYLSRIERLDPELNSFLILTGEEAMDAARAAEQAVTRGDELGPLHGLPISIKDTQVVKGVRTTKGSLLFEDSEIPEHDSAIAERVRDAGAIILGKTNVPEFAMVGTCENRLGDPGRNPWNTDCTPGGSSGGGRLRGARVPGRGGGPGDRPAVRYIRCTDCGELVRRAE